MRPENEAEYHLLRKELEALKNCVTTYTGYLVGGSGAAVLSLAAIHEIAQSGANDPRAVIAFGCMSLAFLSQLLFLVLLYKFNSHNRYAGYCNLLSQERHETVARSEHPPNAFGWEYCMAELRRVEREGKGAWASLWLRLPRDMRNKHFRVYKLYKDIRMPMRADRMCFCKPLWVLVLCMLGRTRSASWTFAAHITALFAWVSLGFLMSAAALFYSAVNSPVNLSLGWGFPSTILDLTLTLALPFAVFQLVACWKFGSQMNATLYGSATVDAYYWRFLPLRAKFLREQGYQPRNPIEET